MRKTIVAVYVRRRDAKAAVKALHQDGFTSDQISLVASESPHTADGSKTSQKAVTGGVVGGFAGLAAGLAGMKVPDTSPVMVAGPLASLLGSAVVGVLAGGLIGGFVRVGVPEPDAHLYAESIKRGGTLVSVTVPDELLDLAMNVMERFSPLDLGERAAGWGPEGDEPSMASTEGEMTTAQQAGLTTVQPSSPTVRDPDLTRLRTYVMAETTGRPSNLPASLLGRDSGARPSRPTVVAVPYSLDREDLN